MFYLHILWRDSIDVSIDQQILLPLDNISNVNFWFFENPFLDSMKVCAAFYANAKISRNMFLWLQKNKHITL